MKKLLSILLALLMLTSVLALFASCSDADTTTAVTTEPSGNGDIPDKEPASSEGLVFTKTASGYLVIDYVGSENEIYIASTHKGEKVTALSGDVFDNNPTLTAVNIPSTVTHFYGKEFEGCYNLQYTEYENAYYLGNEQNPYHVLVSADQGISSCTLHENTRMIAPEAFSGCTNLKTVTLNTMLKSIGEKAFFDCSALSSLLMHDTNITYIGKQALEGCATLETITLPQKLSYIDQLSIDLLNISFAEYENAYYLGNPDAPYTVLISAIDKTQTEIKIHPDTKLIAGAAFKGYAGEVEKVILPEGVIGIGSEAFQGTKIREVAVPSGLQFAGRNSLNVKTISLSGLNSWYTLTMFAPVGENYTLSVRGTVISDLVIPASVKAIGDYGFSGARFDSVTIGGKTAFGLGVFTACQSLKTVTLPSDMTELCPGMFTDCQALAAVTLPEELKTVAMNALAQTGITEITLPEGCETVEMFAFSGCTALTKITLPKSLTAMDITAFHNATALKEIVFEGTKSEWTALAEGLVLPESCTVTCSDGKIA